MRFQTTAIIALRLTFLLASLTWLTKPAQAGGGPENVLLVVNSASSSSKTIANHYVQLRNIPPANVVYLDWHGPTDKIKVDLFREKILKPIWDQIKLNGIEQQIDYVIYSSDFPWSIDFQDDIPKKLAGEQFFQYPQGSLSGLTYLHDPVMARDAAGYVGSPEVGWFTSNRYMRLRDKWNGQVREIPIVPSGPLHGIIPGDAENRPPDPQLAPQPIADTAEPSSVGSHGFQHRYGWGRNGELVEVGGDHYWLSAMLGVTSGRGNTVAEILNYLDRSASADGTQPPGTIYFMRNGGVRTTTRQPAFEMVVDLLKKLGVNAEVLPDELPQNRNDVQGLLCGVAEYNWPKTGSTILTGAICETLTSWAGNFETKEQTPLSVFLRYGASGSSGTVTEPNAIQNKFPYATIQLHYARGCTLAEAFYQSVFAPYQLIIVGDPLCRPWANIPQVSVSEVSAGEVLKGRITLHPTAKLPHGGAVNRFELFVDGVRMANCNASETLSLDTTRFSDGCHELRVVGIEDSPIESQGRQIIPVSFDNYGKTIRFDVKPDKTVRAGQAITITASAPGAKGVAIYQNYRVVAEIPKDKDMATIDSKLLGNGPVTLRAVGFGNGGAPTHIYSAPVLLTIE